MAEMIFQRIAREGRMSKVNQLDVQNSIEWYRNKVKQFRTININRVFADSPEYRLRMNMNSDMIGSMLLFQYDAKWKDKLPYYDQSPLIFPLEFYGDSMLGLNMHYLSPFRRAQLMNALYSLEVGENSRTKRLSISYGILKGASQFVYFKPCVKKYLLDHVQSRFMKILPSEWQPTLFLPLARFVGASSAKVWSDSNRIIGGNI